MVLGHWEAGGAAEEGGGVNNSWLFVTGQPGVSKELRADELLDGFFIIGILHKLDDLFLILDWVVVLTFSWDLAEVNGVGTESLHNILLGHINSGSCSWIEGTTLKGVNSRIDTSLPVLLEETLALEKRHWGIFPVLSFALDETLVVPGKAAHVGSLVPEVGSLLP